jgi:hypothetical protein
MLDAGCWMLNGKIKRGGNTASFLFPDIGCFMLLKFHNMHVRLMS